MARIVKNVVISPNPISTCERLVNVIDNSI